MKKNEKKSSAPVKLSLKRERIVLLGVRTGIKAGISNGKCYSDLPGPMCNQ